MTHKTESHCHVKVCQSSASRSSSWLTSLSESHVGRFSTDPTTSLLSYCFSTVCPVSPQPYKHITCAGLHPPIRTQKASEKSRCVYQHLLLLQAKNSLGCLVNIIAGHYGNQIVWLVDLNTGPASTLKSLLVHYQCALANFISHRVVIADTVTYYILCFVRAAAGRRRNSWLCPRKASDWDAK